MKRGSGRGGSRLGRTLAFALLAAPAAAHAAGTLEVWKSPACGCCGAWVQHLEASGLRVRVHEVQDLDAARRMNGVPQALGSCHTARVEGYAVEGHVPAADIKRMIAERPKAAGLAVPGMPPGSPGMPSAQPQPFESLLFTADGRHTVWQRHRR